MLLHMRMTLTIAFVLFLAKLVETHRAESPRLAFTDKDTRLRRIALQHVIQNNHIRLVEDGKERVIVAADQYLYSLDFDKEHGTTVAPLQSSRSRCEGGPTDKPCALNITVLHKRNGTNQVLMCETSETGTTCCNRELSPSAECSPSNSLKDIASTIKEYRLSTGEPSVFTESSGRDYLYVTQSSTENSIGIYKFGPKQVRPTAPENEPKYLGLAAFTGTNKMEDKLYAFFKERNTAGGLESDMWTPFVAQVCMEDEGGPKNKLQYQWTSLLKARLFCGDKASRRHFSELVDVAFHHENGTLSRVYALFHNEWGVSAVCIFSIDAISKVFQTSSFKGNKETVPSPRPGACEQLRGSADDLLKRLSFVQNHPEMDDRVFSMNGPLLVSHHHKYTHIRLHAVPNQRSDRHILLYLSLESGKIHKVLENKTGGFIIAEYRPFGDKTHILDMIVHSAERKLYVSSSVEVVQVDLQSCDKYGQRCEDCLLARDPYCGWNTTHCADKSLILQDVEKGNHSNCPSWTGHKVYEQDKTHAVPLQSRHFLRCPITSRHAEYTWHLPGNATTACLTKEHQCDLLIDGMGPEKEGVYKCTAEELGYTRTVVVGRLLVERKGTQAVPASAGLGRYGGSSAGWLVAISLLHLAAIFVVQSTA
ncbi:unnamed protein product [Lota lota]